MEGVDTARFETFLACDLDEYPERLHVFRGLPLFPTTAANTLRALFALSRLVKQLGIDVIHSHHRFTSVIARLVSMSTGCRFTSTVHDLATGGVRMTRFGAASVVMVFSDAVEKHLTDAFGIPPSRIQQIPMGIGPMTRSNDRPARPTVAFAGRLDWEKGPDILLAAAPEILRHLPATVVRIAGSGELDRELRAHATSFAGHVVFAGWQDDVAAFLSSADIVVVPSRREGFGRTVVEAMSLGVPVVASAAGEIRNLIEDGVSGVLVPIGDPAALAAAVVRLLADRQLADRIGAEGQKRTLGKYSVAAMCRSTEQVYEHVMAS
jgi:glycosyltransferase involved in cell wall biosynthesis